MISPTIGRVVLIQKRPGSTDIKQAEPALVTYVWTDRIINVGGFDHNGIPFAGTSVTLLQDNDEAPDHVYAEWMPYQKGQAAKTEALEAAAGKAA